MTSVLLTLAGLWVLLGAVWFAVWPLVAAAGGSVSTAALDLQDLEAEKARLIAEIHELELDGATGKLSEEDYGVIEARLKSRAVDVMREIEARDPTAGVPET